MSEADTLLLRQWRQGDEAAFDELFLRHYPQVYRVLYGLVGSREAAEDLAQDTFLSFYRSPPALEADSSLAAWLCRVALNNGYNALRGERRERLRLERAFEPSPPLDPEAEALRADERARVTAVLASLPERQARLLLLRHAGLSYAEVAAALDVAPGSVGTLLARAERAFQAAFERAAPAVARGRVEREEP